MDADRWLRIAPWLDELLDTPTDARGARLAVLRARDAELADELERLIALEDGHEDFLSQPIVDAQPSARAGAEIGPYRLERMLGEGGMGQVWLADRSDGLVQRRVAVKLLRPGLVDTDLRARFTRERQILARLAHPHIARLLDAGMSRDGVPYLALDYVDGIPITDWCRAQDTAPDDCLRMLVQVCDAVAHAHANLIVHRDLKPSNILVTAAGEVRLLDFGIAKLLDTSIASPEPTRTGTRAFTLHYAAPEQIRGEPVTTMTDVYALGVVLYELLTLRKPYQPERRTDAAWEEAILQVAPTRPSQRVREIEEGDDGPAPDARRRARRYAGDLDNIVLKALAKSPAARYASVDAFALDLQRCLAGKAVQARSPGVGHRIGSLLLRHRARLLAAAAAIAGVGIAFGALAWQAWHAQRDAARSAAAERVLSSVLEQAVVDASRAEPGDELGVFLDSAGRRAVAWPDQAERRATALVLARMQLARGDASSTRFLLERGVAGTGVPADAHQRVELELLRARLLAEDGDMAGCADHLRLHLPAARQVAASAPTQAVAYDVEYAKCLRALGDTARADRLLDRARRGSGS